jgi:hypothetical protein
MLKYQDVMIRFHQSEKENNVLSSTIIIIVCKYHLKYIIILVDENSMKIA